MYQRQSIPRWLRYWNFGSGLLTLVATGALYVAFDPSSALAYLDLLVLVSVAVLSFLSGLGIQFRVGMRRIRAKHFAAASQLLCGVLLLSLPAVAFLEQVIEPWNVLAGVGGLLLLSFGLGTLYRPATFGPYASTD